MSNDSKGMELGLDSILNMSKKAKELVPGISGERLLGAIELQIAHEIQKHFSRVPKKKRGRPKSKSCATFFYKCAFICAINAEKEQSNIKNDSEAATRIAIRCRRQGLKDRKGNDIYRDKILRDLQNRKRKGLGKIVDSLYRGLKKKNPNITWKSLEDGFFDQYSAALVEDEVI